MGGERRAAARSRSRRRRSSAAAAVRSSAAASARRAAGRAVGGGGGRGRLARERGRARLRGPLALGDRAAGGGAQLAQLLVQARAVAGDVVRRARARAARACARALERPRGGPGARAARRCAAQRARGRAAQSTGTAVSAAWVGVEHATAATSSSSVRSVWWPTLEITGTRSSATVRHSVSSQNANRSASEPPPRATTITSTSSHAARSCSARRDRRARRGGPARARTPTRAAPPSRGGAGPASTSSRALPDSPVTTPMQRGSVGRGSAFCGSNSPSACELAAQLLELGEQVALAGHAQPRDREGERRRRGPRARVVVAPARDDHLRAVGQRPEPQLVEVLAPHRARQRAGGVAQLEPHLRPPGLEPEHLAEHLHLREPAQPVAQRGRVLPDGERAGEVEPGMPSTCRDASQPGGRLGARSRGRRHVGARRRTRDHGLASRRNERRRVANRYGHPPTASRSRGAAADARGRLAARTAAGHRRAVRVARPRPDAARAARARTVRRTVVARVREQLQRAGSSARRCAQRQLWRPELALRARTSSSFNPRTTPGHRAVARLLGAR